MQVEMRMKTDDTNVSRKFNTKKQAREFLKKYYSQILNAAIYVYDDGHWYINEVLK